MVHKLSRVSRPVSSVYKSRSARVSQFVVLTWWVTDKLHDSVLKVLALGRPLEVSLGHAIQKPSSELQGRYSPFRIPSSCGPCAVGL